MQFDRTSYHQMAFQCNWNIFEAAVPYPYYDLQCKSAKRILQCIKRGLFLYRPRILLDSSRVCSMSFVMTSSRRVNSLSEKEDRNLCILSCRGIKIISIFLSNLLLLIGSTMVLRLSFGSLVLLTYLPFLSDL